MDMHLRPQLELVRVWRQMLTVAAVFWALCLVLVALEATMGAHFVLGALYFLSIPLLVAFVVWATKDLAAVLRRGLPAIVIHAACVLVFASLIVLVGLLAASNLKSLMLGA
jgi:hypothetical protein